MKSLNYLMVLLQNIFFIINFLLWFLFLFFFDFDLIGFSFLDFFFELFERCLSDLFLLFFKDGLDLLFVDDFVHFLGFDDGFLKGTVLVIVTFTSTFSDSFLLLSNLNL